MTDREFDDKVYNLLFAMNVRAAIVFGSVLIVCLLVYIFFFK